MPCRTPLAAKLTFPRRRKVRELRFHLWGEKLRSLPFARRKSPWGTPPSPTEPHSAAVSSFAALRMRHTPCGYFVGLWWGPLGLFSARNAFVKPCNTQSIPAVLHLFLTKNLSSDSLADLCGIALNIRMLIFGDSLPLKLLL